MAKVSFKYTPPPGLGVAPPRMPFEQPLPARDDAPLTAAQKADRWWHQSSYDLKCGLDISEDWGDTLPGDLLDELFKRD